MAEKENDPKHPDESIDEFFKRLIRGWYLLYFLLPALYLAIVLLV